MLCNLDPRKVQEVAAELKGTAAKKVSGTILTAATMQAHNTFEKPETLKPAAFDGAKLDGVKLSVTLPAKSVVVLEIE